MVEQRTVVFGPSHSNVGCPPKADAPMAQKLGEFEEA